MNRINLLLGMSIVALPALAVSPYLSKVYDYRPAPGQFVNTLPEYEEGDTQESINRKVEEQICFEKMPGMISLGGFGGYVVVGFDHPVVNCHGRYDFKIFGNAFYTGEDSSSAEPGIVMVSVDSNGNGLADDEWYELAGSEFDNKNTRRGVHITYYKPSPDKEATPSETIPGIVDSTYIKYTTDDPERPEGYIMKNTFHSQSYWPEWEEGETMSFVGTRLPDNVVEPSGEGGVYVMKPFEWGYVDNHPNGESKGFSLDWAVDEEGKPVLLEKVDFIKVYTAELENCGWLGEESTEVSGGEDLHPEAVYSAEWPENPETPSIPNGVSSVVSTDSALIGVIGGEVILRLSQKSHVALYSTSGLPVYSRVLPEGDNVLDFKGIVPGIYILKAGNRNYKISL